MESILIQGPALRTQKRYQAFVFATTASLSDLRDAGS